MSEDNTSRALSTDTCPSLEYAIFDLSFVVDGKRRGEGRRGRACRIFRTPVLHLHFELEVLRPHMLAATTALPGI